MSAHLCGPEALEALSGAGVAVALGQLLPVPGTVAHSQQTKKNLFLSSHIHR